MRSLLTIILLLSVSAGLTAQTDLLLVQYIYNQYAVNPAFAGSRGGLTAFASFRKQWTDIESTPRSILFTAHSPLRNNHLAIGFTASNQTIHQSSVTAFTGALSYRIPLGTNKSFVEFALQPGVSLRKTDWTKVNIYDQADPAFSENTSNISPLLGFGVTFYGRQFFVGANIASFIVSRDFDLQDAEFAPADATYLFTGGYQFNLGDITLQPSIMVQYQKDADPQIDATLTPGWNDFIFIELGYRTTGEAIAGVSVRPKPMPQLRVSYNYEMTTGDLKGFNNGSHEISIQYDFVYRTKNVGPRFF